MKEKELYFKYLDLLRFQTIGTSIRSELLCQEFGILEEEASEIISEYNKQIGFRPQLLNE
mgnify:FL=1